MGFIIFIFLRGIAFNNNSRLQDTTASTPQETPAGRARSLQCHPCNILQNLDFGRTTKNLEILRARTCFAFDMNRLRMSIEVGHSALEADA